MHAPHPDVHDVGLVDRCSGCADAAADPTANLDATMLRDLLARTLDNRFRASLSAPARSHPEAVAMANVLTALEKVGKLAEVAPEEVRWYLSERWKIDLATGETALTRAEAALGPTLLSQDYDACRRVREALRGYIVRRGDMVPGATAEDWVRSATELLSDLVVALGPECPPLDQLVALARQKEMEP